MLSATRREALIGVSHVCFFWHVLQDAQDHRVRLHTIVAMRLVPGAHRIIAGFHYACIDQARCLLIR